ncbi:hypothetical protein FSARC_10288 [Fusarium sarcochroum]|uniref:Uncharacterized protein n=1 Tax=Fusarium sarcochroum TaxID=1208366 RepID=A0A8H4X4U2_9HYPO|nr:hypothetical protein FSARC_10288 [Fusarium sarcochroum]
MASDVLPGMAAYAVPSLFQPDRAREAICDARKKTPLLIGILWVPARASLCPRFFSVLDKHDKPYGSPEGLQKAIERMSFIFMTADVIHLAAIGQDLQQAREFVASTSSKADGQNGAKGAEKECACPGDL